MLDKEKILVEGSFFSLLIWIPVYQPLVLFLHYKRLKVCAGRLCLKKVLSGTEQCEGESCYYYMFM